MNNEQIELFGNSEREIEENLRQSFNKIFDYEKKRLQTQIKKADEEEEIRA